MDDFAKLESEYCPPLDPALFSAIALDFDLSTAQGIQDARTTLDPLKEFALLEEAAEFDPSGAGGNTIEGAAENDIEGAQSNPETTGSQSKDTDLTSVSNGLSSMGLADSDHNQDDEQRAALEGLDDDTKVLLLRELFGEHVSEYSVRHTLKKCNGRWNSAMEELLNHVYFDSANDSEDGTKVTAKGVDGFSDDQILPRTKRKKNKVRRRGEVDENLSPYASESSSPGPNKWQASDKDIDFISLRLHFSKATVRSTYYEQGASVPQTINALLKKHMQTQNGGQQQNKESIAEFARELGQDFPTITHSYLVGLIQATYPSSAAAHELAKALVSRPTEASRGGVIIPQYHRPTSKDLDDLAGPSPWQKARSRPATPQHNITTSSASALASAREQAFAQASAAHRRARSDRLMGGAAAYYSQVGREYTAASANATASAADNLAATQSSSRQVDLHGIDVLNGVRIAEEKVEAWWSGLGENRANGRLGAAERADGFGIVVGLGRHSEGGKGKLGPAVVKMLKGRGWRFENQGAVIVVKGRT